MKHAFRWTLGLLAVLMLINSSLRTAAAQKAPPEEATGYLTNNVTEHTVSLALAPNTGGTHWLTIRNPGSTSLSHRLSISSTYGWFTQPTATYMVPANSSLKVGFNVFVPAGAAEGSYDKLTVMAIASNNAIVGTSTFFTHVLSNPPAATPSIRLAATSQGVYETTGKVMVKVTRPADALQTFSSINYTTLDGTAVSRCATTGCTTDYTTNTNRLIFYPGQAEASFTVVIKNDTLSEPAENFSIQLSNPLNASLDPLAAKSTITILRPVVVPATTKAVDATTAQALTGYAADGTLTFSQSTPLLDSLQTNHIIVSDVHAVAPSGFLRRVTGKTVSPTGQITVTTVEATLSEAIQDGGGVFSRDLVLADAASITLAPGVTIEEPGAGRGTVPPVPTTAFARLKIEKLVLHDGDNNPITTNDQVYLDGTITIDPNIDFNFDMGWFELDYFKFNVALNEVADLKVRAPIGTKELKFFKEPKRIAEAPLKPFTIMVGFIPLVFEPKLEVFVNIEGTIKADLVFSVKQIFSANAGVEHVNDVWSNISDISSEVIAQDPTLAASLEAKAYARAEASIMLYGRAGPKLTGEVGFKLTANTAATPWWKLERYLKIHTDISLTIFDQEVAKLERVLYERIWLVKQAAAPALDRVSITTEGAQSNGHSYVPDISADGRYTVFASDASNLAAGDTNGKGDIFLRDKQLGTTTLISRSSGGTLGNGDSREPKISADGRYVVYTSEAKNLVGNDTNIYSDVFVYNVATRQTSLVSAAADGSVGNSTSYNPDISDDGSTIVFASNSTNLTGPAGTEPFTQGRIYLRNVAAGQTTLVSRGLGGAIPNNQSAYPKISGNGKVVVFQSKASNLVANDTNGFVDYFLYDHAAGQLSLVGTTLSAMFYSDPNSDISADGNVVVFSTPVSMLADDSNGLNDIYLSNRSTGDVKLVSRGGSNGSSFGPRISADGNSVAFISQASNLVDGDTNGKSDAFLYDSEQQAIVRMSIRNDRGQFDDDIQNLALSADGRNVAWQSGATNIVTGDTNGMFDIFVYTR